MIDFHTHILPGIDDGSESVAETAALLEEEVRQGVTKVIATPHFYAHRRSVDDFLQRRARSMDRIRELRDRPNCPEIMTGAEVYFFPGMGRADKLKELCIEGTDLILVEMPFKQWTEEVYENIRDIIQKQKLRVVLAHVDRYPQFQKKKGIWDSVMDLPLTPQINAESLTDGFRHRRFSLELLRQRTDVIIGSDCHNMTNRKPNLQEACRVIEKKLGKERIQQLDKAAAALLGD